jgi:hypothetical protein
MILNNVRTYKALLILSSVFFIGMTAFGIIPSLITDVPIWEQSFSLKGIGIIFGFVFMISMLAYIYVAISTIKPYRTISNYLKVIHVLMMLALYSYILPDVILINQNIKITLFISFGVVIIGTNIMCYLKAKNPIVEQDNLVKEEFISNIKLITNEKDGIFLFNMIFWAILMLSISSEDINTIPGYVVILIINAYIIFKYIKSTLSTKEEAKIIITASIILYVIIIALLEIMPNINVSYFGVIFALSPSIYWFPKILRNYYTIVWNYLKE